MPFDWAGQVAAVAAMGALTYGAIEAGAVGLAVPRVLAVLAVAVVALAAFLVIEARGPHPMMPLGLVRSRPVAVSVSIGFAFTVGFYGLVFLFSLYFQEVRGLSPLATGLAFMPMTALSIVMNPVAARLVERFGPRLPIASGQVLMAAGLLGLCVAAAGASIPLLSLLTIPVGFGAALAIPTMTALLMNSVPAERAGTASGVLNTCRQLGGALSVAVFGALVAHRATFLAGLQVSLVIAALLLFATAAASLLLPRVPAATAQAEQPPARPLDRAATDEAWSAAC